MRFIRSLRRDEKYFSRLILNGELSPFIVFRDLHNKGAKLYRSPYYIAPYNEAVHHQGQPHQFQLNIIYVGFFFIAEIWLVILPRCLSRPLTNDKFSHIV